VNASRSTPAKPIHWISSAHRDLKRLPEDVQDMFGRARLDIQFGDRTLAARRFGEGVRREISKLLADSDGNTYRVAYTVEFPHIVYVLDVFAMKSKSGISTPRLIRARVEARYRLADAHFKEHQSRTP